jgi:hypothetical protein
VSALATGGAASALTVAAAELGAAGGGAALGGGDGAHAPSANERTLTTTGRINER